MSAEERNASYPLVLNDPRVLVSKVRVRASLMNVIGEKILSDMDLGSLPRHSRFRGGRMSKLGGLKSGGRRP